MCHAARASHLVLGLKFPKPAQAGLGVAGTELLLFFFLHVQGCWWMVVSTWCQHGGDAWDDANRLCLQKRKVWDFGRRARTLSCFNWIPIQGCLPGLEGGRTGGRKGWYPAISFISLHKPERRKWQDLILPLCALPPCSGPCQLWLPHLHIPEQAGGGVTRGLCGKSRSELEVGRKHPMSAGAGGNASVEWRWEVGWVCFESGKRGKCSQSLCKCRKAGWAGVCRADTRGARGRGKRRMEFVSLKCLWEGAGSNERGSCGIWNKSGFCRSAGGAGNELPLLCVVSPSCGTFSSTCASWHCSSSSEDWVLLIKSHNFALLRGVRFSWKRVATGRLRMREVSGGTPVWQLILAHCFLFPETCMRAVSYCYLWGVLCFLACASALVLFINLFLEWYCLEQLRIM